MATKNDAALLEAGREGEGAFPSDGMTAPKLILALGRGKTGKSTFIRWAAETALERGRRAGHCRCRSHQRNASGVL